MAFRLSFVRVGAGAVAFVAAQACYNYVPLETAPPVGERVALELTDRGRVGLADRFGPGIESIEGRLLSDQSNEYVINVYRVSQINGSTALWSGEQTHVSRDFVGTVRKRELSRFRTGLLVGGITAGLVALAAKGLSGSYSAPPEPAPPTGPISIRRPLHP